MSAPALLIRLELEALPRVYLLAKTVEEEVRLRAWLASEPSGLDELLEVVGATPEELFPWLEP